MDLIIIILLAFSLCMDTFAVSVTCGLVVTEMRLRHALRVGLIFGAVQAVSPLLGWLAGRSLVDLISGFDHWVAFGILCFIGGRMIFDAFRIEAKEKDVASLTVRFLLVLAVATSLDALAVGLVFAVQKVRIVTPVVVIGAVTFLVSFVGTWLGSRIGHFFEKKIEILGGLVLIGIGVKILLDHLG